MKLAVIVQRYGPAINGGAELHARYVAEHLARHAEVEVLTTCASDYVTWRNELSPGEDRVNGVLVRRFRVKIEREPHAFSKRSEHVFEHQHSMADELKWLEAEGPTSRAGTTGPDGRIVFENLPAGTYRFRIERDSFVTLEKEIPAWAGVRTASQAVLSAGAATPAPAAPPPPAPMPTPSMSTPVLKAGEPRVLSLTDDIAEKLIREKDPVAERQLGCSGATASRLVRVNDSLAVHSHADADEVLYIIAGEATLKLGDKEQTVSPGWFSLVPRGMAHSLTKRGRGPVLLLSSVSGPPCQ